MAERRRRARWQDYGGVYAEGARDSPPPKQFAQAAELVASLDGPSRRMYANSRYPGQDMIDRVLDCEQSVR